MGDIKEVNQMFAGRCAHKLFKIYVEESCALWHCVIPIFKESLN